MILLDDKWNESTRLMEEAKNVLHPARIIAGDAPLSEANCSDRQLAEKSGNRAKKERNVKGEDFVWKRGLERLKYPTVLILPIFFTRQYLGRAGKKPTRLLMQTTE